MVAENKLVIFGDVHGNTNWKDVLKKENPDEVIFLGDYADSHFISPRACIDNAKEIFELASSNPKKIHLLVGNHDFHYMRHSNSTYSGYSYSFASEYYELFKAYESLFKVACWIKQPTSVYGMYKITSHAGISNTFLTNNNLTINDLMVEDLNDLWKTNPRAFDFIVTREADPFGDDEFQGPLWIRPRALKTDMAFYHQIVGHTNHEFPTTTRIGVNKNILEVVCHPNKVDHKLLINCHCIQRP